MQRPQKQKEARSGGNKKRGKTVKFKGVEKDVDKMIAHDAPIPSKRKGEENAKKTESKKYNAVSSEDGRTYGIDRLNLREPENES